ncbi:MAG TPA: cytochrome c oxidase subunit II [Phycisphaerales bacterium]|nr:cytochrome c oxidase subunit II [Phycisphaerales bacterium]HMP36633.1 cytochrome c oxidase subunit II [Phycisphaerales bacterium]
MSGIAAIAAGPIFPVLAPESPQAEAIYDLGVRVVLVAAVIFSVMAILIGVAAVRFRERSGRDATIDFGSHRAEVWWMLGPLLVVFWLAAISAKLVLTINAVPAAHPEGDPAEGGDRCDILVTGHQWWWEVSYPRTDPKGGPAGDSGAAITTANEIHIPVGRRLRVRVESADVIHSFWVPQLARKIDAIPGRTNHIWLEANRPGEYQGFCAEFCGTQHAWMRFRVIAHGESEYRGWLAAMRRPPEPGDGAQAALGARLFRSLACIECHALEGTGSTAANGPDLTHLDRRRILAGGAVVNSPANLAAWLRNPGQFKPGSKMPDFKLDDERIAALIAFIAPGFAEADAAAPPVGAADGGNSSAGESPR